MIGRRVSYVFLLFAVAITVVAEEPDETEPGDVNIWDTTVKLTCPTNFNDDTTDESYKWYKDSKEIHKGKSYTINNYNNKNDGLYYCSLESDKTLPPQYFFIKAKVCEHCIELDMGMALLVVFADMLVTLIIVLLVYYCTRKRAGSAAPQRPTQTRQPRPQARGPPPPDPDYQPLNPITRSNDVYAMAQRQ